MTWKEFQKQRQKLFNEIMKRYDTRLAQANRAIFDAVVDDLLSRMDYKDGKLVQSASNYGRMQQLDTLLNEYKEAFLDPVLTGFGKNMVGLQALGLKYYEKYGISNRTAGIIDRKLNVISEGLGIGRNGKLIKGGFLDTLAEPTALKTRLKKTILDSVSQGASQSDAIKSFREVITGKKGVDSTMLRYTKQYVHDALYQTSRTEDSIIADEIGLQFAVYGGTQIDTTREFCAEKIEKVFHRSEIEAWSDEEWAGKNEPYDPIRDLGGYNCRHELLWISIAEAASRRGVSEEELRQEYNISNDNIF